MSKQLEEFKKAFVNFQNYPIQVAIGSGKKKVPFKFFELIEQGASDFSKLPWVELNTKTLADFKVINIYKAFRRKVSDTIFEMPKSKNIFLKDDTPIPNLNIIQLAQVLDFIIVMTNKALQESLNSRTTLEVIVDFLKVCVNFLISLITFGYKPNFFKPSTVGLEMFKQKQQNLYQLFDKLSDEEKRVELNIQDFPEDMQELKKILTELQEGEKNKFYLT